MQPALEKCFARLDGDEAWPGIFYIEANPDRPLPTKRVGALCFLIGEDGLIVTCSHVAMDFADEPWGVLTLNAAFAPLTVKAEILREGWSGPRWGSDKRNITSADWGADIAFLRLLPNSAHYNDSGIAKVDTSLSPVDCLYDKGKVLALAAPGYFPGSKSPLTAHHVTYSDEGKPERSPSQASFRSSSHSLHHGMVVLDSDVISNGDSGGPIWDRDRKRVVAMVRRGAKHLDDTELAADTRTICELSGKQLTIDLDAELLLETLKRFHELSSISKHFQLLSDFLEGSYIDLRVKKVPSMSFPDSEGQSAIESILRTENFEKCRFLLGGPGSGKSKLFQHVADHLISTPTSYNGKRLVPLIFHAREFERFGLNTKEILKHVVEMMDTSLHRHRLPHEILYQNDLALLILIDGLDEVNDASKARLLALLTRSSQSKADETLDKLVDDNTFFIVATRPVEDLRITGQSADTNAIVLELQPLNSAEIDLFFDSHGHEGDAKGVLRELAEILSWGHAGPTPLQIAFLLHYAKHSKISSIGISRPVDLHMCLAEHLLRVGDQADSRDRSSRLQEIRDNIWRVIGAVANSYLKGNTQLSSVLQSEEVQSLEFEYQDIRDFLIDERQLLGAIVSFDSEPGNEWSIVWPHRTVAEAFSAHYLAESVTDHIKAAEVFRNSSHTSQSHEILFLSLIDQTSLRGDFASNLVARKLGNGLSNKRIIWFSLRLLAAGVRLDEHNYSILVTLLMKVLYYSTGGRQISAVWGLLCSELFASAGANGPDPVSVAKMQIVKKYVTAKLNSNLERRARIYGFARLSSAEAHLIEELEIHADIDVPILSPDGSQRLRPTTYAPNHRPHEEIVNSETMNVDNVDLGRFASQLLARYPEHFVQEFRAHLSESSTSEDPSEVLRDFLISYTASFADYKNI